MKYLSMFLLLIFSFKTFAERQTGIITGLVPFESNGKKIIVFKLEDNVSGECNTTARFAFDDSKINYDLMASTLLSAYHSKTRVQVEFNRTCHAWGNSFDSRYICIGDINC
ncbi:hypothetical protein C1E23_13280 [Pseudoalteromonas phenolica]|uniref:Uncharacterized protein n=1 Tax=Pseudoalteromonas phenolica TaxID=161398 RepID=A0A4Q7INL2_9GAMM|nr:hypothetical protein [Pseudoalteromonas phenolica]RZQ52627.1 hypothetical protein C1E23_13280 [Pseudoalteromonas phenolica]